MSNFDDLFENEKYNDNENKPFDKDSWAEKKQQERTEAYALLDQATEEIAADPDKFKDYLDTQSRFDRYSPGNAILIAFQHPGATKVADFMSWKDHNAFVNKGEKAIVMLEPGSEFTREDGSTGVNVNVKKVFDISQTSEAKTESKRKMPDPRAAIKALIASSPCKLALVEQLTVSNAKYSPDKDTIFVVRGLEANELFRSLAFEICIAKCAAKGIERQEGMFPSYCSAYMLCARNGFETQSFNFEKAPEQFTDKDLKEIRASLGSIRDMANEVSQDMSRQFESMEKNKRSRDNGAR